MNKTELIAATAQNAGVTKKDAERVVNAALEIIAQKLAEGEKVQLSGFGIFEAKQRQSRIGRNPHTRQTVEIPAARVPGFKASQLLKDKVGK